MGQLLAVMPKNTGGRPAETCNTMLQVSVPTLADYGIERILSHRCQQVAAVFLCHALSFFGQNRTGQGRRRYRAPVAVPGGGHGFPVAVAHLGGQVEAPEEEKGGQPFALGLCHAGEQRGGPGNCRIA